MNIIIFFTFLLKFTENSLILGFDKIPYSFNFFPYQQFVWPGYSYDSPHSWPGLNVSAFKHFPNLIQFLSFHMKVAPASWPAFNVSAFECLIHFIISISYSFFIQLFYLSLISFLSFLTSPILTGVECVRILTFHGSPADYKLCSVLSIRVDTSQVSKIQIQIPNISWPKLRLTNTNTNTNTEHICC